MVVHRIIECSGTIQRLTTPETLNSHCKKMEVMEQTQFLTDMT